jgi:hypothetical protein
MRRLAIWAIVLGCGAASAAMAAPPAVTSPSAAALAEAAFLPSAASADLDTSSLFEHDSFAPGVGLFRWSGGQQALIGHGAGTVDSLSINVGALSVGPGGLPLVGTHGDVTSPAYQVNMVRNWPRAFSFGAHGVDFDVSPHAGLGMDSYGAGSAEAGATLHISKSDLAGQRLQALGMRDGRTFGDRGRWYLFAAASGRAVGLNMMHGDTGWNRAGWSTDPTSRLVGDTQVGVGFLKGPLQTSFGFVHRDVKGEHLMYGVDPHSESMVALSFAIRRH